MNPVALFTHRNSVYQSLGIECWDESRNAMLYTGNNPVIAHPPCNLWGKMAAVNFRRYGGEHNRPGNDGGMFAFAIATALRCGGVVEHPAHSKAWAAHGLDRPVKGRWIPCGTSAQGWTCQVSQSAYGHRARKNTWLFFVGPHPRDLDWSSPEGTHQIGHDSKRGGRNKPVLWNLHASATPIRFAQALIDLVSGT